MENNFQIKGDANFKGFFQKLLEKSNFIVF